MGFLHRVVLMRGVWRAVWKVHVSSSLNCFQSLRSCTEVGQNVPAAEGWYRRLLERKAGICHGTMWFNVRTPHRSRLVSPPQVIRRWCQDMVILGHWGSCTEVFRPRAKPRAATLEPTQSRACGGCIHRHGVGRPHNALMPRVRDAWYMPHVAGICLGGVPPVGDVPASEYKRVSSWVHL